MRQFIDLIESPSKDDKRPEAGLKDKDDDLFFDMPQSKGELAPSAQAGLPTDAPLPGKKARRGAFRNRADAETARRAIGHWSDAVASGLHDTQPVDFAGDDTDLAHSHDGYIEETPPTPENLPAVIQDAMLATKGDAKTPMIEPQWHMVRDLPGFRQTAIRAIGRQVFAPFTDTPIERIQVLSTLSNDEAEVKYMMAWIKKNGVRDDQAELKFHDLMPGYHAEVQVWNTSGYSFVLVHDFGGFYVYGWPGGRGVHVGHAAPRSLPRR